MTFANHAAAIKKDINQKWDQEIIPKLMEYIRIPNKSPMFDKEWEKHGYMDQAMQLMVDWCKQQPIKNMQLEVARLPGHTPLLFIEIPGQINETVLLYGHMDKQPEMVGWDADKGPWIPLLKGDQLFGRGGADDGYAVFAILTAIQMLQKYNIPHGRCVVMIEACEESGSYDLPAYLKHFAEKLGEPNLVICLDTGCGDYERMWSTTSLRGIIGGKLEIEVLTEGIHSGVGSGIVPSTVMVLRQLLDRIENKETGEILLPELKTDIPAQRIEEAQHTATCLGETIYQAIPFASGVKPMPGSLAELLLQRTWHAKLAITGADGFPDIENAGNVTLPKIAVKLSMRVPPTCSAKKAVDALKIVLENNPPFNAKVTFTPDPAGAGWHAPELSDWLAKANERASQTFFGKAPGYLGEGGSIPFLGKLAKMFPQTQFLNTGVLGPKSNAHGPNEFLHIPMAKNLTGCVASVIADHYKNFV